MKGVRLVECSTGLFTTHLRSGPEIKRPPSWSLYSSYKRVTEEVVLDTM